MKLNTMTKKLLLIGSVRATARMLKISPTTVARLRKGHIPDIATLIKVMEAIDAKSVTITRDDFS